MRTTLHMKARRVGAYLILHETNERTYDDCSLLCDQRWQLITAHINQLFDVRSFAGQDWTLTHMVLPEYKLCPNSNILLHSTYIHCAALSHKDLCHPYANHMESSERETESLITR
jgi:hypothetical protein